MMYPSQREIDSQYRLELRGLMVNAERDELEDAIAAAPNKLFSTLNDAIFMDDYAYIGATIREMFVVYFTAEARRRAEAWAESVAVIEQEKIERGAA